MRALVHSQECAEAPGADRVISALGVNRQKASPWDIEFVGNLRLLEEKEHHGLALFHYVNVL